MLLTQRENKVSKLKAGYEYQEILKKKSDFKVQNLPLMLSSCHDDGSRTLWLPKLENAIYQKPFNVMYYFFSNNPLASEKKRFYFRGRNLYETWLGTVVFILVIFCCYNKLHIQTW